MSVWPQEMAWRRLRQFTPTGGISSLFATSYGEKPASAGNAALGCLRKPYDQKSLVQSIQIVEQVMNGLEPTLSLPRSLELYQRTITSVEPAA
jgi:hypothetical protein